MAEHGTEVSLGQDLGFGAKAGYGTEHGAGQGAGQELYKGLGMDTGM